MNDPHNNENIGESTSTSWWWNGISNSGNSNDKQTTAVVVIIITLTAVVAAYWWYSRGNTSTFNMRFQSNLTPEERRERRERALRAVAERSMPSQGGEPEEDRKKLSQQQQQQQQSSVVVNEPQSSLKQRAKKADDDETTNKKETPRQAAAVAVALRKQEQKQEEATTINNKNINDDDDDDQSKPPKAPARTTKAAPKEISDKETPKPKKRKTQKPTSQILTETLERVFGRVSSCVPANTDDWEPQQQQRALVMMKVIPADASFATLATYYGKLQQEILSSSSSRRQQQQQQQTQIVKDCLQNWSQQVRQQATQLLEQEAKQNYSTKNSAKTPWIVLDESSSSSSMMMMTDTNHSSAEMDDLFAMYEASPSEEPPTMPATHDLLTLLEALHPALTADFLQDWNESIADFVWQQQLQRLADWFQPQQKRQQQSANDVLTCLTAVSTLVQRSTAIRHAIGRTFLNESSSSSSNKNSTGRQLESCVSLQPLLALCAYTTLVQQQEQQLQQQSRHSSSTWQKQLQQDVPHFPVGALTQSGAVPTRSCVDNARRVQQSAQRVMVTVVRQVMKLSAQHKRAVFEWMRQVATVNESLADMLRAELLSEEGLTALSSSWPFLLGTTWTLVGLCTESLVKRFDKMGASAFDQTYLHVYMGDSMTTNPLVLRRATSQSKTATDTKAFDGASEFFFLSCWLLRTSLYPLLRVEHEFHQRNRQILALIQDRANQDQLTLPAHLQEMGRHVVAVWLGLDAFLQDPEFGPLVTQFALLQLRWVHAVLQNPQSNVPDWFAKEPARWLAHVAQQQQQQQQHRPQLKSWHAEQAIMVTTQLLTLGSQGDQQSFSPLVLTELIRVAAAFVRAGVSRARRKEHRRHRRRGFGAQPPQVDDTVVDERALDAYISFDASDLGVAVFTNQLVCKELCPTLLQTFRALDIVEGLDVDKEASFDKFSVKVEIADLLIRLWGHPNGECHTSILQQSEQEIGRFASSVAAAIGYLLDDACQRFSDVTKASKRRKNLLMSARDQGFIEAQSNGAVSGFLCARRLLLLLCRFSMEPKIASAICSTAASDMAAMVVHFLDILTSPEGGTNSELDWMSLTPESSKSLAAREASMSAFERRSAASSLVGARTKCRKLFGLDVSILSHQLLALAARWCFPSADLDASAPALAWLSALSGQEDCDATRYKAILDRLICLPTVSNGATANTAALVFKHDGYVDASIWVNEEISAELTEKQKQWRRTAAQEQMSHSEIDVLANHDKISKFVRALGQHRATSEVTTFRSDDLQRIQNDILEQETRLAEEGYGDILSEWVVSSEPFANTNDGAIIHFFEKTARNNGVAGSGKILVKEARKCHKGIPVPHANSAVYVCFAEERMDLCRAVVTGPVDTPYAHGIFVMDVYFPPTYPQIPPLVHFMTTGGGQVRFGPNLYQDGKVCLSLLGTFHAADESQKWNPQISSLAQILLSIQTQLLTSEPYFNEPGHESMVNTPAGRDGSRRYNSKRRLDTIRHAIVGQLREPPKGFEEVTRRHFAMCRQRIVAQARRWTLEARGSVLEARFTKSYGQLLSLLSEHDCSSCESLPPLKEDITYLSREDPAFVCRGIEQDRKPTASSSTATTTQQEQMAALLAAAIATNNGSSNNPWANANTASSSWPTPHTAKNGDDDDDDDFYS